MEAINTNLLSRLKAHIFKSVWCEIYFKIEFAKFLHNKICIIIFYIMKHNENFLVYTDVNITNSYFPVMWQWSTKVLLQIQHFVELSKFLSSFFFHQVFLSWTLKTHRRAGEGRGPSFIPFYHFQLLTNIQRLICNFACEIIFTYI